jgi:DNA-binding MarR family transcriptional regulator
MAKDNARARGNRALDRATAHTFLHHGHVFSHAVNELLEAKPLAEASGGTVTVPQFHLLKMIALDGGFQVGELAQLLGVTSPAVSKNIQKLERLGLVTRRQSQADRRVTLLSASAKGLELVKRHDRLKSERLAPVLSQFDQDELDTVLDLMDRISSLLYQREDAAVNFCLRCAAYGDPHCTIAQVHGVCPYADPSGNGETAGN